MTHPPRTNSAPKPGLRMPGQVAGLSAEAERQDKLAQGKFEAEAKRLAAAQTDRPAVVMAPEVDAIRTKYTTGQGRHDALASLVRTRHAYWVEMAGGDKANLTDFQRAEAKEFFEVYGMRLLGQQRQAPPNPLKEQQQARAAHQAEIEQAKAATKAQASLPPPAEPNPVGPVATEPNPVGPTLGQGPIVDRPAPTTPTGISAEVEYEDRSGFPWRVRLTPGTNLMEIAALMKLAGDLREKMVAAGAKPPSIPGPVIVPAGAAAGQGDEAVPICAIHKVPMNKRPSKTGGHFWSCSQKLDDGSYCPYKPKGQ